MNNLSKKVIIIGPAHPLRGGIASFNHRLARQFMLDGHECSIYSFSLQYPSIFFPGKTQFTTEPAPQDIRIYSRINSVNPFSWFAVGNAIRDQKPDLVVMRFWIPFLAPALGTIARRIKKNNHTKIIAITDNVVPHEKRIGDNTFTKYFFNSCDAFVTMSLEVMAELKEFEKEKPAICVKHPLLDNFGDPLPKKEARAKLGIDPDVDLILFFGFIRKYKGLDILIQAMTFVKEKRNVKLLVAGEFYEDEKQYNEFIDELNIRDSLIMHNHFIPDSEVRFYLSAADAVIQPYRNATQSGVTPLAFHFEKPMVVTNVGGLPEFVSHEKAGIVTEPDPQSIADGILRFYELGEDYFIPHLRNEKQKYSWQKLVETLVDLSESK